MKRVVDRVRGVEGSRVQEKRAWDPFEAEVLHSGQTRLRLHRYLRLLFFRCDHPIAASKQDP